jgi:hypothetical protein
MVSIAEGSSGAVTGFSRDYFEHFGYTLSVNYGSAVSSDFNPNSFSFWSGNTKWIYFEAYSDVLIEGPENFKVTVNKYVLPGHEGDAQIGPDGPTSRIEVQIDDKTVIPVKVPLFNIPFSDPIFRTVEVDWKNYTEVLDKLNKYRKEYAAAISEAKNLIYQAEIENAEAMQKWGDVAKEAVVTAVSVVDSYVPSKGDFEAVIKIADTLNTVNQAGKDVQTVFSGDALSSIDAGINFAGTIASVVSNSPSVKAINTGYSGGKMAGSVAVTAANVAYFNAQLDYADSKLPTLIESYDLVISSINKIESAVARRSYALELESGSKFSALSDASENVSISSVELAGVKYTRMNSSYYKSGAENEVIYVDKELGATKIEFSQSFKNVAIDAGDGVDVVAIPFASSEIGFVKSDGIVFVSVGDATLTIVDTERLELSDGTLAFDTDGIAGQAYRIYKAAFNRTPDNDGLKFWIGELDKGMSLLQAASGFVGSAEFNSAYGGATDNLGIVQKFYQNVLGREGEAGGVSYWTGELDSGSKSTAQVLADFSASPENVAGVAPLISDGIFYA